MELKREFIIKCENLGKPVNKIAIPCGILFLVYFILWNGNIVKNSFLSNHGPIIPIVSIIALLFMSVVIHEFLHAVAFLKFTKCKLSAIKFGIKDGNPYCHCTGKIKVKHYKVVLLMPLMLLGVASYCIGLYINEVFLIGLGLFNIISAAGDICVFNLLKNLDKDSFIEDHPSEIGFYIYD